MDSNSPLPSLKLYAFLDTKLFYGGWVSGATRFRGGSANGRLAFNRLYLNFSASGTFLPPPLPMFEVFSTASSQNCARQKRASRAVTAFRTDFLKSFRANAATIHQNRLRAAEFAKPQSVLFLTTSPAYGSIGVTWWEGTNASSLFFLPKNNFLLATELERGKQKKRGKSVG